MKTLAVVTMFFLPGSFISALFSTQCFDWDRVDKTRWGSIGITLTPQFILYWVITIPLTILTFILYFMWLKYQSWQRAFMMDDLKKRLARSDTGVIPASVPSSNGKRMHTMNIAMLSQAPGKEGPWIRLKKMMARNP